jgi:hypothetical protein
MGETLVGVNSILQCHRVHFEILLLNPRLLIKFLLCSFYLVFFDAVAWFRIAIFGEHNNCVHAKCAIPIIFISL